MRGSKDLKTYLKWGIFFVLPLYLIDQLSKWYVNKHILIGDEIVVIPGFFEMLHVRNTGVAFGLLQDLPLQFRTIFFFIVTVIACGVIVYIFNQAKANGSFFMKLFPALVFAGALGNLTDRLVRHEVVDFIKWHIRDYFYWPNFNVADMYITVGMIGLLFFMLKNPDKENNDKAI